MATIIEMITAIVMLTPEDANLLKTTHPAPIQKTSIKTIPHPGIFSFILIYNSIFKYHSAKYKRKKRRPNRHPSPGIAKHPLHKWTNLSTLRYIIRRVIPPNFYPRKIKERCLDIQVIIIEVTDRLTSFWQFFQLTISGNRN